MRLMMDEIYQILLVLGKRQQMEGAEPTELVLETNSSPMKIPILILVSTIKIRWIFQPANC